jgi:hypothetical protein
MLAKFVLHFFVIFLLSSTEKFEIVDVAQICLHFFVIFLLCSTELKSIEALVFVLFKSIEIFPLRPPLSKLDLHAPSTDTLNFDTSVKTFFHSS